MSYLKREKSIIGYLLTLLVLFVIFCTTDVLAKDENIYKDGIYRYKITNENENEVELVGIELNEQNTELKIPSKVRLNEKEYTVTDISFEFQYYNDKKYQKSYDIISKIVIDENFIGKFTLPRLFYNVKIFEFKGEVAPVAIKVNFHEVFDHYDFLFKVPKGKEADYKKVIEFSMECYNESEIAIEPVIVSADTDIIEHQLFVKGELIYQVTKSGVTSVGEVKLVGTKERQFTRYLKLPEEVEYGGYKYKLTKLAARSLTGTLSRIIHVSDTVHELDKFVFSENVELIFLSKNIKVIPQGMISSGENGSNLKFIYVPEGVTTIEDNAFTMYSTNKASIILPKSIKNIGAKSLYGFKLVTFLNDKPMENIASAIQSGTTVKVTKAAFADYRKLLNSKILMEEAKSVVKSTSISIDKKSVNTNTAKTTTLVGTLTKGSNETVYWLSSDSSIFDISSKGVLNPKKAGTAYAVAYTRTSGLHQAIKVTVTDTIFTDGIYKYKVTDASKKSVTLIEVKPTSSTKILNIPETVVYNKKIYKVTSVMAGDKDTSLPLIKDRYKNNKITEITFPKSITGVVGYLGQMQNIKSITFKGSKAPEGIFNWYEDDSLLAFQSIIYVPKGAVDSYKSVLVTLAWYDAYFTRSYSCDMMFNILEVGSTERQWFIKEGILYKIVKKAGTKSGTVTVHGADVTLKTIKVGGTVIDGKYKYNVTAVSDGAFRGSYAEKITLGSTITKVGERVFNQRAKSVVWSKNTKTIGTYLFAPSYDLYLKYESFEVDNMAKENAFYALTSFAIPSGVTTIQKNVFKVGFGNVKALTIPKSVTKIGTDAFKSISKVVYATK